MNDTELVQELSLRANVPETSARALLEALRDLVREGRAREDVVWPPIRTAPPTDPAAVDDLIASARLHPLGLEFLRHGFLGSVAAEFHVHAFTVDAARTRLAAEEAPACR